MNKNASQKITVQDTAKFGDVGDKDVKFNTDEKKETKKLDDIKAAEFTFKSKESENQPKKADRYESSQDRSDDDLDKQ